MAHDVPKTPGWILDEEAHAGPEHLDVEYLSDYDAKAKTDPSEDVSLFLDLGLGAGSTVLDVGTGTGTFALAAAPHCARVVAVDVPAPMLERLRARAREAGIDNVEPVRAGFLTDEHRGPPADFAYSRNALHHLPDFWKAVALERLSDTLAPGGFLLLRDLVYSFGPAEAGQAIEAWVGGASPRPGEGWTRSELEDHVRSEHSTFSWLLEPMLERAGFEIRERESRESGPYAAYLCARRA